jgi:2-epi-valiolone-7-phosphate 1-reductase
MRTAAGTSLVRGKSPRLHLEDRSLSSRTGTELVRVLRAGVCGTDLQILRGIRGDTAAVLGHEGIGEVVGSPDEQGCVLFNPVNPEAQDDILGHSFDGVFQEFAEVPSRCLLPVSPRLPADLTVLIEPLAAVLYGWELITRKRQPAELGVWGGGVTGVLAALVGEIEGADVHLIHRRRERLRYLAGLGILEHTGLHVSDDDAPRLPDLDAIIICTSREGSARALSEAMDSAAHGAVIDLLGGFAVGDKLSRQENVDLGAVRRANVCGLAAEGSYRAAKSASGTVWLTGHRGTSSAHIKASQRLLSQFPRRFGQVLTSVVSLAKAAPLLSEMASAVPDGRSCERLKIVIDPASAVSEREPDLNTTVAELRRAG